MNNKDDKPTDHDDLAIKAAFSKIGMKPLSDWTEEELAKAKEDAKKKKIELYEKREKARKRAGEISKMSRASNEEFLGG